MTEHRPHIERAAGAFREDHFQPASLTFDLGDWVSVWLERTDLDAFPIEVDLGISR